MCLGIRKQLNSVISHLTLASQFILTFSVCSVWKVHASGKHWHWIQLHIADKYIHSPRFVIRSLLSRYLLQLLLLWLLLLLLLLLSTDCIVYIRDIRPCACATSIESNMYSWREHANCVFIAYIALRNRKREREIKAKANMWFDLNGIQTYTKHDFDNFYVFAFFLVMNDLYQSPRLVGMCLCICHIRF